MKFFVHTFGCQMNENDSARIASLLLSAGHEQTLSCEEADIIVVNTCCVRQNAENRAFGYIGSLKKLKEQNPELTIAVCGCMVQKEGTAEAFLQHYRFVGVLIGTFALARLPEYISAYQERGEVIVDVEEDHTAVDAGPVLSPAAGTHKAQVNIIYGCDNFCSYCIVPYVRGRERSRAPQQILTEVKALVQAGVKEIQLLGQNVNAYGKGLSADWDFARLLGELDRVEGLARIRYMTSHPRDFSPRLVEVIAASRHICHHFHLPLQSGCDKLLAAMNRGYDTAYYGRLLETIRSYVPDAAITSDMIMGFPGETEDDFQQTLDFVAACQFDAAYTFIYSQRSGTPAAQMAEQVSVEVKKERLQRLAAVQNPISLKRNQNLVGSRQTILAEGPSKNNPSRWSGRTDGNKVVVFSHDESMGLIPGAMAAVRITAAQTWNLSGELLMVGDNQQINI